MQYLGLLVLLAIVCFFIWAAQRLIQAFGIQEPMKTLIYIVLAAIVLFGLLGQIHVGTAPLVPWCRS